MPLCRVLRWGPRSATRSRARVSAVPILRGEADHCRSDSRSSPRLRSCRAAWSP